MPKFIATVAVNIPHYGSYEVEAEDADHALSLIKSAKLSVVLDGALHDPDWDSFSMARIVCITPETGDDIFHEDIPLTAEGRLLDAAPKMLVALQKAVPILREAILAGVYPMDDIRDRLALDAAEDAIAKAGAP